jgi:hypothetical protein
VQRQVPTRSRRVVGVIAIAIVGATSCGDPDAASTSTDTASTSPTTTAVAPTTETSTTSPSTSTSTSSAPTTIAPTTSVVPAPTTTLPGPTTIALWPAATVVLATPEEAAAGFVDVAFAGLAILGPFQSGDQDSGEIQLFASEDGTTPMGTARSTLLLRRLPPTNGWFVIGAVSPLASIDEPTIGATVSAGPVTIVGSGIGFEATIVIEAFDVATGQLLDQVVTMAGTWEEPGPFEVDLDLSGSAPGDVVILLVRGSSGLEVDPGDAAAIAVVVG